MSALCQWPSVLLLVATEFPLVAIIPPLVAGECPHVAIECLHVPGCGGGLGQRRH